MRLQSVAISALWALQLTQNLPAVAADESACQGASGFQDGYVVSLALQDEKQRSTEVVLLVAAPEFSTRFLDANGNPSSFQGTVTPERDGGIRLQYVLTSDVPAFGNQGTIANRFSTSTNATVRLALNEPAQIMKSAGLVATLQVSQRADPVVR